VFWVQLSAGVRCCVPKIKIMCICVLLLLVLGVVNVFSLSVSHLFTPRCHFMCDICLSGFPFNYFVAVLD
jgi:hypothetical protein